MGLSRNFHSFTKFNMKEKKKSNADIAPKPKPPVDANAKMDPNAKVDPKVQSDSKDYSRVFADSS